jgi:hypothetical protein
MNGVILPFPHTPSWSAHGQLCVCISELVPCIQQSTIFFVKYLIIVEFFFFRWGQLKERSSCLNFVIHLRRMFI